MTSVSRAPIPAVGTLLILGASGDLTNRLLLPGLASLQASGRGKPLFVLGTGTAEYSPAEWQERIKTSFASAGVKGREVTATARRSRYERADVTKTEDLQRLIDRCEGTPAIYFALPPAITAAACAALGRVDLPEGTLLVMEKPFGVDEPSARELNRVVSRLVPEDQIFRVDHFLGRGDVLNILGVRFANRILEPVWNNLHVEKIEIIYDEDLALEGRAGYYDHAGALVDMIQSHLLQIMALLMMEAPATMSQRDFRDGKCAILRATHPRGGPVRAGRRARYTGGTMNGHKVPAYTREKGVDPSRGTDTLAELTLEVDTWRWAGVPVTLRSGKALGRPRKEAVITFKPTPHLPKGLTGTDRPDTVTFGFKPPRLAWGLDVNGPGDPLELDPVDLVAELESSDLTAYGEVLEGVLASDPLLAVRGDVAEECWRIVDPVIAAWRDGKVEMDTYPAGSDGPRNWK